MILILGLLKDVVNIEKIIFIFAFCIGLNHSGFVVLKHHYITKRIREHLIYNLKFLIQILLWQLFFYTDVKESCLFVTRNVETLDLNKFGKGDDLATVVSRLDRY